ncbi:MULTISPECIES: RNA polymerase sigma factor [unclassified Cryobacterium]|uniref:RNA polymerase sigma factor n=1 Tax=unclassified Cryobacterium TaxID=2649013 RepID=UPI00106BF49B|nr:MULTISPECIES: sigma-70 family RNA polymerase sigma factor [unclassified Cryobacterium]TFC54551.1 sigma-70 family RNA polymerase sigma factor [Cryobacterium sp. TMB3-1-2]TFC70867.1 sigma-70 family RNA polymerase sigma factor [Cryobacterium sp. TMB3-15]TFC77320.1 sigma-70 family RNA polymerase sigma factor [Cryobacterium sp. TMB3-10]TFD45254.1 sigma-70 family RNA polymerase sigma factor [Cryobacterium sp. TMB3-12]
MTGTSNVTALTEVRSFEASIRPLMPKLLAYFTRRVLPSVDAADCLSETLVVLWRRRSELPGDEDGLRAWSYGVAKGVLANHQRSQIRRTRLSERLRDDLSRSPSPTVAADTGLSEALATLSDVDKDLVLLVAWDGFGVAEAGELLGLTPGAARSRYSRARKALREQLA